MNTYTVSFFNHRVIEDPLLMEHYLEKQDTSSITIGGAIY